jgi:hypothetical protein
MIVKVPLRIIDLHEDGYHPLVEVVIYGQPFTLVLDTGASKTAFDQTMLSQAGNSLEITASDRLSTGLGTNTMASSTTLVKDMYLGELLIPQFEVAVLDLSAINIAYQQMNHPEILGVLGGDILMKYQARVDYGKSLLTLILPR